MDPNAYGRFMKSQQQQSRMIKSIVNNPASFLTNFKDLSTPSVENKFKNRRNINTAMRNPRRTYQSDPEVLKSVGSATSVPYGTRSGAGIGSQ